MHYNLKEIPIMSKLKDCFVLKKFFALHFDARGALYAIKLSTKLLQSYFMEKPIFAISVITMI